MRSGPSYGDDHGPLIPQLYTYELPVFTGIFDNTGSPIFRQRNPIGFGRDNEWATISRPDTSKYESSRERKGSF